MIKLKKTFSIYNIKNYTLTINHVLSCIVYTFCMFNLQQKQYIGFYIQLTSTSREHKISLREKQNSVDPYI